VSGYLRVVPRDLFNEADLLKCLGRLVLDLDDRRDLAATIAHDGGAFVVEQDERSGAISVANVVLVAHGFPVRLFRPLNSRASWPLWAEADDEDLRVFTEAGVLSDEFLRFLRPRLPLDALRRGQDLSGARRLPDGSVGG
jgi:hypothetical protein